jgi:hypothetical protein
MINLLVSTFLPSAVRLLNYFLDSNAEKDANIKQARDHFRKGFTAMAASPSTPAKLAREYQRQNSGGQ